MELTPLIDLEKILSARLSVAQGERLHLKNSLDFVDTKLKGMKERIGKKPTETIEQIRVALQELEHNHVISGRTKADERTFMHEIGKFNEKKKRIAEYTKLQAELDETKATRTNLSRELAEKEKNITELLTGIRKLRTALRLGCSTTELVEHEIEVPVDDLPRLVGKGGSRLRQLEDMCGVSIEVDRSGGNKIRILGPDRNIAGAVAAISITVNSASEEFSPRDETIVCLILNKAAVVLDLQARYEVKIDVSRAKQLVRISGLKTSVVEAVRFVQAIDSKRIEFGIDPRMLPVIIGKDGSTVRALQESGRVEIDISREENRIVVVGYSDEVTRVAAMLKSMLEENKEVEESLLVPRQFAVEVVLGPGGSLVRNFQKQFGILIAVAFGANPGDDAKIAFKGPFGKVSVAKAHFVALHEDYAGKIRVIVIPSHCMPVLIGKKGVNIKALRERFPGATIEVEGNTIVRVRSEFSSSHEGVKAAIDEVVEANYVEEVALDQQQIINLKSLRSKGLRELLTRDLNLTLDFDEDRLVVTIRGRGLDVEMGKVELQNFIRRNHSELFSLSQSDATFLLGEESVFSNLESEFSVSLYVDRKTSKLKITGEEESVRRCHEVVVAILEGDITRGTLLIEVDPRCFPALIGKAGATAKAFEQEHGVRMDIIKAKNAIRLSGTEERVLAAGIALRCIAAAVRIQSTVAMDELEACSSSKLDLCIRSTADLFKIDVRKSESGIVFSGQLDTVPRAQAHFMEAVSGRGRATVKITPSHAQVLKTSGAKALKAIEAEYDVRIDVEESCLALTGEVENVTRARNAVTVYFNTAFPSEFLTVVMDPRALAELATFKKLCEIEAKTLATTEVDVVRSCVLVQGEAASVGEAVEILRNNLRSWNECHASVVIQEFMIPLFLASNAAKLSTIQQASKARVSLNRSALRIEVEGRDGHSTSSAASMLEALVNKFQAERWTTSIPVELIGQFVGKEGQHIRALQQETAATILLVDRLNGTIVVTGEAQAVRAARDRIEQFIAETKEKSSSLTISVPLRGIPSIVGAGGSQIRGIESESGAHLDLNRTNGTIVFRGSASACQAAKEKVESILIASGFLNPAPQPVPEKVAEVAAVEPSKLPPQIPPGASPELMSRIMAAQMSKSSRRRRRQRMQMDEVLSEGGEEREGERDREDISEEVELERSVTTTATSSPSPPPPPLPLPVPVSVAKPVVTIQPPIPARVSIGGTKDGYYQSKSGFSIRL